MRQHLLLLLTSMLACGDDGSAQPDAGAAVDAGASQSADARPPDGGGLPGTWRHRVIVDEPAEGGDAVYVFVPDGTFTYDEEQDDEHLAGTYALEGDRLILDGTDPDGVQVHIESSIHLAASGDLVLLDALLADGPVDGVVGTWRGFFHIDAGDGRDADRFGVDSQLVLAEGGTGELTELAYQLEPGDPEVTAITWVLAADVLSWEPGPFGPLSNLVVDGAAMSQIVLERLE